MRHSFGILEIGVMQQHKTNRKQGTSLKRLPDSSDSQQAAVTVEVVVLETGDMLIAAVQKKVQQ